MINYVLIMSWQVLYLNIGQSILELWFAPQSDKRNTKAEEMEKLTYFTIIEVLSMNTFPGYLSN